MTSLAHQAIQAAIFDMDGVITQTMKAHFAAWKTVFDAFLQDRAETRGERAMPFQLQDYFNMVDGVPRFEGVRRFLASRGITLPEGAPDSLDANTVHGLGNRKNRRYLAWLDENAVPTYADALDLIGALKRCGIKVGIFSASRNADRVLTSAGVMDVFDAKVDGADAERLGLPPKPHPAILIETLDRLGAEPAHGIVVEDAVSGVEAGAAAGFRLVVGVDREQLSEDVHQRALRAAGADLVTRDLREAIPLCLHAEAGS